MNYIIGKLIFKGIFMSGGDYDTLEIAKEMIETIQVNEIECDETPCCLSTLDIFNGYMSEAQKRYVTNVSQGFFVQSIGGSKDIKVHCLNNTLLVEIFDEFIDCINNKRPIKEFYFKIRVNYCLFNGRKLPKTPSTKKDQQEA